MTRDLIDPTPEEQNVVLIDAATVQKAQRVIAACETCSNDAESPLESVLDWLTGSDPSITDYILEIPTRCLQCGGQITEKTLVAWDRSSSLRHQRLHQ